MREPRKSRAITLTAIVLMMIVAAASGYRFQIGISGVTFERDSPIHR